MLVSMLTTQNYTETLLWVNATVFLSLPPPFFSVNNLKMYIRVQKYLLLVRYSWYIT
jgi:hypothetical protein